MHRKKSFTHSITAIIVQRKFKLIFSNYALTFYISILKGKSAIVLNTCDKYFAESITDPEIKESLGPQSYGTLNFFNNLKL